MAELTTFAGMSNTLETAENTAAPTQQQTAATSNLDTSTQANNTEQQTNVQQADNTTASDQTAQQTENTQQQTSATDISDFSLSLGDETDTQQAGTTQQQTAQPAYNWKEEIKKIDRKELLKEVGLNDFSVEMDDYIKGGGQPVDYLSNRAIDYTKVSDDALIKDDLRKQYPTFSPQQIDLMFDRKYAPLSELQDDKDFAELQLQADAYKVRQAKVAEQQRFKVPEAVIPQKNEAYEQWEQNRQVQAQKVEEMKNYYSSHPATKSLNESKRVTLNLGEGVAPFNFQIDKPEMLTRIFTDDGSSWRKLTSTTQGEPDVAKQQMIALFTYNPQKFIQDIFKYGQSHGLKEVVEEGQNAQKPQAKVATMTNTTGQTISVGKFGDRARN